MILYHKCYLVFRDSLQGITLHALRNEYAGDLNEKHLLLILYLVWTAAFSLRCSRPLFSYKKHLYFLSTDFFWICFASYLIHHFLADFSRANMLQNCRNSLIRFWRIPNNFSPKKSNDFLSLIFHALVKNHWSIANSEVWSREEPTKVL